MTSNRRRFAAIGLIAPLSLALFVCAPPQDSAEAEARPVGGDISRVQMVQTKAEAPGQLRGENQASIRPGVGGTISQIKLLPGAEVRRGDVILTLDQGAVRGPVGYLDYKVTTPIAGVLAELDVSQGEFVNAQQELGWVVGPGDLEALIRISDRYRSRVNPGDSVTFRPLGQDESHSGSVVSVSTVPDSDTRDIVVRTRFSREGNNLLPGLYGDFEIVVEEKDMLTIPQEALRIDNERTYVFVVEPVTFTVNRVQIEIDETIETADLSFVVTGGLDAGQFVVTQGDVFDGDTARVRQSPAFPDEARDQRVAEWEADARGEDAPDATELQD